MWCPTDGPELWSSVHFHDYSTSSKDQMAMGLSASCPLHPRATLCWREAADEAAPCHDIPNSTASEDEQVGAPDLEVSQDVGPCHSVGHPLDLRVPVGQWVGPVAVWVRDGNCDTLHLFQVYILDKVDVHPQLCFRVSPCGWVGTISEGAGGCSGCGQLTLPFADPISPQFSYKNSSHVECPHQSGESYEQEAALG